MSREHDDEQEDGGASAHDRKSRTRARARAQAAPMAVPNGCPACSRTGMRTIAEHDRQGETCDLHQTFCGCPLGVHLHGQRGGEFFYAVREAITARFRVAVVDPTPAQCRAGGAILRDIPKLGEYVSRASFQRLEHPPEDYTPDNARRGYRFARPPLTVAEARAWLDWPADGPPRSPTADPARPPRTAHILPLSGDSAAASWSRAPVNRPTSSFERASVDAHRPLDLGGVPHPEDRRELAPGGVPDSPPPWIDDDAQPPWMR